MKVSTCKAPRFQGYLPDQVNIPAEEHTELLRHKTRQARMLSHRHILRIFDFIRPEGERAAITNG